MAGCVRVTTAVGCFTFWVASAIAASAFGGVPADARLAAADMLRTSDFRPVGMWTAGKLSTGPNTARCTVAGSGDRGVTANARRMFTGGGFQVIEAVQILETTAMVDQEWRGANVPRLLRCLTAEVRAHAGAVILESKVVHPDLPGVASRVIALRVLFQPRINPPRVELEDIDIVLSGRTLVELATNGTYLSMSDAVSGTSFQLGMETRLLQIVSERAKLD
jgi:hypothetical protein